MDAFSASFLATTSIFLGFAWHLRSRYSESKRSLQEKKETCEALSKELEGLRSHFQKESLLKAALEERVKLIEKYEADLVANQAKVESLFKEISLLREHEATLKSQLIEREKALEEKILLLEDSRNELTKQFSLISQGALEKNNRIFLDLARESLESHQKQAKVELEQRHVSIKDSVKNLHETLEKLELHNHDLEKKRIAAYSGLSEQVRNLMDSQLRLQAETSNLVTALRAPSQRGRWGEIQLKRVVEMAGMLEYCDFEQQVNVNTDEGRLRPDLVVKLPNAKNIVVDSKVSLEAYLEVVNETCEEQRCKYLQAHARQVRKHIIQLSAKAYWQQFEPSPEFVVMFMPGEPMFTAALEQDPQLIEFGAENRVLIATPMTLIALLRAVAFGWRQEKIAASAQEISAMAQDLYSRIGILAEHFVKLGTNLDRSVVAYNETVGSMERKVLPQLRRLKEKGIARGDEIAVLQSIDKVSREFQAPELKALILDS